ncbi:hypothetical protein LX64_02667 [Chitinophaga skermanii]|uniref:Uncharacterized protein n=2 Tax=Chitinophaga skermanii TaxID=331697 RepID=A0A327QUU9_9BACT|nr:hypothetical protein LX64_02667 [Chitinophaga skermanii]
MPFSRYVSDEEGGPQVPLIYYTDGRWIWVSYLTFFLKKGYYSLLSEEFIKSIGQNNFVIPTLDDGNKVEAIRYYYSIYHPELLKDDDLKD